MTFENLLAWQEARHLAKLVYRLARQTPLRQDYSLSDQARRAAVSAMSNLAEGFERVHHAEKLQFWNVAHASAGEIRSLSYVIEDAEIVAADESIALRLQASKVGALIQGLIRSQRRRSQT
jgi:four helix bundle protein